MRTSVEITLDDADGVEWTVRATVVFDGPVSEDSGGFGFEDLEASSDGGKTWVDLLDTTLDVGEVDVRLVAEAESTFAYGENSAGGLETKDLATDEFLDLVSEYGANFMEPMGGGNRGVVREFQDQSAAEDFADEVVSLPGVTSAIYQEDEGHTVAVTFAEEASADGLSAKADYDPDATEAVLAWSYLVDALQTIHSDSEMHKEMYRRARELNSGYSDPFHADPHFLEFAEEVIAEDLGDEITRRAEEFIELFEELNEGKSAGGGMETKGQYEQDLADLTTLVELAQEYGGDIKENLRTAAMVWDEDNNYDTPFNDAHRAFDSAFQFLGQVGRLSDGMHPTHGGIAKVQDEVLGMIEKAEEALAILEGLDPSEGQDPDDVRKAQENSISQIANYITYLEDIDRQLDLIAEAPAEEEENSNDDDDKENEDEGQDAYEEKGLEAKSKRSLVEGIILSRDMDYAGAGNDLNDAVDGLIDAEDMDEAARCAQEIIDAWEDLDRDEYPNREIAELAERLIAEIEDKSAGATLRTKSLESALNPLWSLVTQIQKDSEDWSGKAGAIVDSRCDDVLSVLDDLMARGEDDMGDLPGLLDDLDSLVEAVRDADEPESADLLEERTNVLREYRGTDDKSAGATLRTKSTGHEIMERLFALADSNADEHAGNIEALAELAHDVRWDVLIELVQETIEGLPDDDERIEALQKVRDDVRDMVEDGGRPRGLSAGALVTKSTDEILEAFDAMKAAITSAEESTYADIDADTGESADGRAEEAATVFSDLNDLVLDLRDAIKSGSWTDASYLIDSIVNTNYAMDEAERLQELIEAELEGTEEASAGATLRTKDDGGARGIPEAVDLLEDLGFSELADRLVEAVDSGDEDAVGNILRDVQDAYVADDQGESVTENIDAWDRCIKVLDRWLRNRGKSAGDLVPAWDRALETKYSDSVAYINPMPARNCIPDSTVIDELRALSARVEVSRDTLVGNANDLMLSGSDYDGEISLVNELKRLMDALEFCAADLEFQFERPENERYYSWPSAVQYPMSIAISAIGALTGHREHAGVVSALVRVRDSLQTFADEACASTVSVI